jgi:hypothetical protein
VKKTILLIFSLGCSDPATIPTYIPDAIAPDAVICPNNTSDRVVGGECLCGVSPVCVDPTECRHGRCYVSDPSGPACEFDDQCPAGHSCIRAHCSPTECEEEICDGFDNDCDGLTDEDGSGGPLSLWCPTGREPLPPCRRGGRVCIGGSFSACMGGVGPVDEVGWFACDGIDNDCDGCIDGTLVGGECLPIHTYIYDTVFVVDISGSMGSSIARLKEEMRTFASVYRGRMEFRFAIVVFPGALASAKLVTDFVEFASFETHLSTVLPNGGGFEPSYDAVQGILDGSFTLSWRSGAVRIIIALTDEPGQSFARPQNTEVSMCGAAIGSEVLAFITRNIDRPDFDLCGDWLDINSEVHGMLHSLIRNPCLP